LVKSINQIATARVVGSCLLSFPGSEIDYILPHTAHVSSLNQLIIEDFLG